MVWVCLGASASLARKLQLCSGLWTSAVAKAVQPPWSSASDSLGFNPIWHATVCMCAAKTLVKGVLQPLSGEVWLWDGSDDSIGLGTHLLEFKHYFWGVQVPSWWWNNGLPFEDRSKPFKTIDTVVKVCKGTWVLIHGILAQKFLVSMLDQLVGGLLLEDGPGKYMQICKYWKDLAWLYHVTRMCLFLVVITGILHHFRLAEYLELAKMTIEIGSPWVSKKYHGEHRKFHRFVQQKAD
jgi:hypothetical protein